jgi:hypothetical protein
MDTFESPSVFIYPPTCVDFHEAPERTIISRTGPVSLESGNKCGRNWWKFVYALKQTWNLLHQFSQNWQPLTKSCLHISCIGFYQNHAKDVENWANFNLRPKSKAFTAPIFTKITLFNGKSWRSTLCTDFHTDRPINTGCSGWEIHLHP